MTGLPLLLVLLLLLHSTPSRSAATTSPSDLQALLDLSASLSPSPFEPSSDPCASWPGVACSPSGRVVAVRLPRLNLSGTLPPSLRNLTSLARLELQSNRLRGHLPSLRGLSLLQTLLLHDNLFSSMPDDFFSGLSSLQSFSLDSNPFPYPFLLPASLRDATALVNFSANAVNLSGPVPAVFADGSLPSLSSLALAYNRLSGPLPAAFASGSPLATLWLNNQRGASPDGALLSGHLDVVANMTNLVQLWLHSNNFSGPIPDLSALHALRDLQLRDNRLTGPVPRSFPPLRRLTLANNLLQGELPVLRPPPEQLEIGKQSFCLDTPGPCDRRVDQLLAVLEPLGYPERFAEDWTGNDPCASWLGISCDRNGSIVIVNFHNMDLAGTISPAFASLASLQKLLLGGNRLTGTIPPALTSLAALTDLDLSRNSLSGPVPAFGQQVHVAVDGNADLAAGSPDPTRSNDSAAADAAAAAGGKRSHSGRSLGGTIAAVVGAAAVFLVAMLVAVRIRRRARRTIGTERTPSAMVIHPRFSGSDPDVVKATVVNYSITGGAAAGTSEDVSRTGSGSSRGDARVVEPGNMVISIQVLRNVTGNFSEDNVLGRGGFGTVYRGELHDGTKIAVKRMEAAAVGTKALEEFKSEISVLSKVRHRHLVSLLGYCLDGSERLLVYEYMPQGTLSRHLFAWKEEGLRPLEWKRRLSIALDVARGVEYLHSLAHQSFIHRDLKPSNILLGDDMKAKVADFGLVRLAPDGKCSVETKLAGTFGYLAPEYAVTGRVTTKADVFSFGVILMELVSGRKALDESQPEESVHLVTWFRRMQLSKDSFHKAVDSAIDIDDDTMASISTVAELAGHCCAREPYQRPDMGHAVNVLSSLAELWKPTELDSEESYGIDLNLTLPQALKKWQAYEGDIHLDAAGTTSYLAGMDDTQTSIPTRPVGFAESFTSADGR